MVKDDKLERDVGKKAWSEYIQSIKDHVGKKAYQLTDKQKECVATNLLELMNDTDASVLYNDVIVTYDSFTYINLIACMPFEHYIACDIIVDTGKEGVE